MSIYKDIWFCRWCGNIYRPLEEGQRDGFCSTKHKQAHHRAYNKYVTRKRGPSPDRGNRVTVDEAKNIIATQQKKPRTEASPGTGKRKSWGCAYCNCANRWNAKTCINCKKPKKVGSPFSLHL